uniref:Uncharacterized protein n=1 Tax=Cacopsylla melanoneura TaxID=428564 RepID=A0A8D8WI16_9HEMI
MESHQSSKDIPLQLRGKISLNHLHTTEHKLCIRPTKSIIRYFTLPLHLPRLTSINNENSSFSRSSTRSSFYTGWYTRPPSIHIQGRSTTRTVRTPCILIR